MTGMDHSVHESHEPFPCKNESVAKKEPEKLLEDCWFFSNLLDNKTSMSKNPSSNQSQQNLPGKSFEETYKLIKRLPRRDESRPSNLIRAPSLPPRMEKKDHNNSTAKGSDKAGRRKSNLKTSSSNLLRAPSLPTLVDEEFHDEEMEFSMGNLIRQASLSSSDTMSPRKHAAKGVTATSSTPKQQSRMKPKPDSPKPEKIRPQAPPMSRLKTQKSLSGLQSEQLQDLGFDFNNENSKPSVISSTPGFQENKKTEENEEKNVRRLHRSQSLAAPIPKQGGERSMEEDLKAQIKFWARAVASNVRQDSETDPGFWYCGGEVGVKQF